MVFRFLLRALGLIILASCAGLSPLVESSMPPLKRVLRRPSIALSQEPSSYCPTCYAEHLAGRNNTPTRRSRRTDGLCATHAPSTNPPTPRPHMRAKRKMSSMPLPSVNRQPSCYCPACYAEYLAGRNNTPTRRSRRTDGLCATHTPLQTPPAAPPRTRAKGKVSPTPLPSVNRQPSCYCPACYAEYLAGRNNKPTCRSRRADGLCATHAPSQNPPTAPPFKRAKTKVSPTPLPSVNRQPSCYCPACYAEYLAGRNNKPTCRSRRADGLCATHAAVTTNPSRKRAAPPAQRTPRKRWRVHEKSPPSNLYTQSYRKCIEPGCLQRARVYTRCKKHHGQLLHGLKGVCAARCALEDHKDAVVPKHCLNNATSTNSSSLSAARSSSAHACAEARFCHECPEPRCRAQYFPEEKHTA